MTVFPPDDAPQMEITLFGPIQVRVHGAPLPRLRSRKALWLLALLTLRHARPVDRTWLAGTLWPEANQSQGFSNLRVILSELRAALGDANDRLRTPSRSTIVLDLESRPGRAVAADVVAFDRAVADPTRLADAVALYRGPLLEGCLEEWVPQERSEREQRCLDALETLATRAEAAGEHDAARAFWRRAVEISPNAERARRGWMTALDRAGDRNAALQTYRDFAERLNRDSSSAPDPATTALYQRLRADARSAVTQTSPTVAATPPPTTTTVPHALNDLIGRDDERRAVADCLRRSRLVTLTGLGGMGKTRLALAVAGDVASEFPDGVWFVALDGIRDEKMLLPQIAATLGVAEGPGKSRPLRNRVTDRLADKNALLVLDNCEHLRAASAQTARELLHACARLRVLATSREPLAIAGEVAWAVPPLDDASAVRLFVERARAARNPFRLTDEKARWVERIAARLDGIPLAIELAAARVRVLTVEELAARLADRFADRLGLLASGNDNGNARQQTLRTALDGSYAMLGDAERSLFERVSVFAGGWSLDAAEEVCAGGIVRSESVLDLLQTLVAQSLVVFEDGATGRYRLLELVRQYAAERRAEPDAAIRATHGRWCVRVAEPTEAERVGPDQGAWLARLDRESDNLRAALAGRGESGLRVAAALWPYWSIRGRYQEGVKYLTDALADAGSADFPDRDPVVGRAWIGVGVLECALGNHPEARAAFNESLRIFTKQDDQRGIAESLNGLASVEYHHNDRARIDVLFARSLEIFRVIGDRAGIANALKGMSYTASAYGEYDRAHALAEESLTLFTQLGDVRNIAALRAALASLARTRGDYAESRRLYEDALRISRSLNDPGFSVQIVANLGNLAYDQGDYETALPLFEQGLAFFQEAGDRFRTAWTFNNLGKVAYARGDLPEARRRYAASLDLRRALGDQDGVALTLSELGNVACAEGDFAAARALFIDSLTRFQKRGDRRGIVENLSRLPMALRAEPSESERAVRLWGAADAQRAAIGAAAPPREAARIAERLGELRGRLGDAAFDAAWNAGQAMTLEQAAEDAARGG